MIIHLKTIIFCLSWYIARHCAVVLCQYQNILYFYTIYHTILFCILLYDVILDYCFSFTKKSSLHLCIITKLFSISILKCNFIPVKTKLNFGILWKSV